MNLRRKLLKLLKKGNKIRPLFFRLKPHILLPAALARGLEKTAYLSRMSRWMSQHRALEVGQTRAELFAHLMKSQKLDGSIRYLEFGVASGTTLRWWLEHNTDPTSEFVGFDTFTGLPEDWDARPQGTFSQEGKPPVIADRRCSFQIGLFQDTLPGFLARDTWTGKNVVHLDADLYSSTLYVLTTLWPLFQGDDVLIFDDFCTLEHPTHVFRAFFDFFSAYPGRYEVVGTSRYGHRVAIKLV